MTSHRVLVTGASGLVGRAAATALAAAGHAVRLMRHHSSVPEGFEIIDAGLEDQTALREALDEIEVVVHAAAVIGGDESTLERVNVRGSENLFRLSLAQNVDRVVFVSTAGVYSGQDLIDMDEDHALEPPDPYTKSKLEGERIGRALLGDSLTILRPVMIYRSGPCPLLDFIGRLLTGGAPMPHNGGADTPVDMVHTADLSQAICSAVRGRGAGGVYNVAGPGAVDFRAAMEQCAEIVKTPPNWMPADSGAPFDSTAHMVAVAPRTVSIARARRDLGYEPIRNWGEQIARLDSTAFGSYH
ncbi:MAG: NAD(P)-dependent oxidoreductase [Planctomycetota bacterium]